MIKIHADGVFVFSAQPGGTNIPLTIEARRNPLQPDSYQGFALLEFEAVGGEVFVDVTVPQGNGTLALYGQLEDIRLVAESRRPVGLRCSLTVTDDALPAQPAFIVVEVKDAAGAALGTLKFQFTCQPVSRLALFRLKPRGSPLAERLPELTCEPARSRTDSFEFETLQAGTSLVSYALSTATPAGGPFTQALVQTATHYVNPNAPLLDAGYTGIPGNIGDAQVFFIEATGTNSPPQRIPFISWIVDTPGRGELVIAAIEPDPRGADRGSESITLENTGTRTLNLTGCSLEDEQKMRIFGITLNLPFDTPQRHVLPLRTRLRPGDRLKINPSFVMNNDFDAFQLRNRLGRALDFRGYLRRLPGTNPQALPPQRVIFRTVVSLSGRIEQAEATLPTRLEDGDFVIIRPDPASRLWSGEIPHTDTGPEGWIGGAVPSGWVLPLPGAPLYALLMLSYPEPRLLGNSTQLIVIDRESKTSQGLGAGTRTIAFQRNDPFVNRAFTWGQFDIQVTVMRH
jgi:hypothetical protein